MNHDRQKQVTFVLLTGIVLTVTGIGFSLLLNIFLPQIHFALHFAILYGIEFGFYCLALYIYRTSVSPVLWFGQGMTMLVFATLVKIVVTVLVYFFLFSLNGRYVGSPGMFLIALFGPFVRGFVIELVLLAIAAKIFETDIFDKTHQKDSRVIDNHLK